MSNYSTALDWTFGSLDATADVPGRALWVSDENLGCFAALPPGVTVKQALEDYASDYDAGDDTEITAEWRLFVDGTETESGRWTFEAK